MAKLFKPGQFKKAVLAISAHSKGKGRKASTPVKKATATRSAPAKRTAAKANVSRQRLVQKRK